MIINLSKVFNPWKTYDICLPKKENGPQEGRFTIKTLNIKQRIKMQRCLAFLGMGSRHVRFAYQ